MSRDIHKITKRIIKSNDEIYNEKAVQKDLHEIKATLKSLEKKIDYLAKIINQKNNDYDLF